MPQENIPRPAPDQLPAIIESLLFVAEEPQSIGTLSKILHTPRQGIERAIETLIESTAGGDALDGAAVCVESVAGGGCCPLTRNSR